MSRKLLSHSLTDMSPDTKAKLYKIAKGACIAGLGAALVAVAEMLKVTEFGEWTPWAVAGASILLNVAKVLKGL